MKKIMFNNRYGLTQAVLEGRKTQTRRILNPTKIFERLSTYEGWTKESIADWKKSCKDRLYKAEGEELKEMLDYALEHSPYKVGENVAIAQRYIDLVANDEFYRLCGVHGMPLEYIRFEKGCDNKMFVKADLMPHRIRITDIRAERLQEISDEDCIAEGIREQYFYSGEEEPEFEGYSYYAKNVLKPLFCTPREAYAALIDKISGKGTWESNPYVFVYEFELIK
jgi:hypothetical protein